MALPSPLARAAGSAAPSHQPGWGLGDLLRALVVLAAGLWMPTVSDEVAAGRPDTPALDLADSRQSGALRPGDVEEGRRLYQRRCARCHAADLNGDGPMHRGVVGRAAASVPGFNYSTALRASGLTWNAATLDRWLADPETLVPGQAMDVQVSNPQARRNLIAYLATFRAGPPGTTAASSASADRR